MPWNRPSSHPTSWACATRSSASLGASSSVNGSESRSSSSDNSGARPSSSSFTERSCISRSRTLLFSSSGEARTSSSSCRIMLPIRMTLAGCSTISTSGRSGSPLSCPPSSLTVMPSGPTTTSLGGGVPSRPVGPVPVWSVMAPSLSLPVECNHRGSASGSVNEQDLPHMRTVLHEAVRLCHLRHRQRAVDHRHHLACGDQRPHLVSHVVDDGRLLRHGAGPQRRGKDADPLAHQGAQVNFRGYPAAGRDLQQPTAGRQRFDVPRQVRGADDVEDDVGAPASGELPHRRHKVVVPV